MASPIVRNRWTIAHFVVRLSAIPMERSGRRRKQAFICDTRGPISRQRVGCKTSEKLPLGRCRLLHRPDLSTDTVDRRTATCILILRAHVHHGSRRTAQTALRLARCALTSGSSWAGKITPPLCQDPDSHGTNPRARRRETRREYCIHLFHDFRKFTTSCVHFSIAPCSGLFPPSGCSTWRVAYSRRLGAGNAPARLIKSQSHHTLSLDETTKRAHSKSHRVSCQTQINVCGDVLYFFPWGSLPFLSFSRFALYRSHPSPAVLQ